MFRIERRHTAGARGRDCLTIMLIRDIACGEYSLNGSLRGITAESRTDRQVPVFIASCPAKSVVFGW